MTTHESMVAARAAQVLGSRQPQSGGEHAPAEGTWTKARAARTALAMQGAVNATGMLHDMHQIGRAFLHREGTMAANQSAPMKLALHQLAFLVTGRELLALDEYSAAARECRRLAEGSE